MPTSLVSLWVWVAAVAVTAAAQVPTPQPLLAESAFGPGLTQGPFVGACDADSIHLWARAATAGHYTLHLQRPGEAELPGVSAEARADRDLTLHWWIRGLRDLGPAPFGYRLVCADKTLVQVDYGYLRPAIADTAPSAAVVFGSCAEERNAGEQPIWGQLVAGHPDALVLLGDTPYIDSTRLEVQRRRYRDFVAHPDIARALRLVSTYATWDDHDFAQNDQFGAVSGRGDSRRAFMENHALATYGEGDAGIYTHFRRGPVEVFVLDTRWFAGVETSPLAAAHRSMLGARQLAWLQRGLLASSAPFKVLCSGVVWNGAVRPGKQDTWATFESERDALFRWLGAKRIAGVVLVGGDLHVTRHLMHQTRELCGYELPEFITSPLAATPIPLNAGQFSVTRFSAAEPTTFLRLEVDAAGAGRGPRLLARIKRGDGMDLHVAYFELRDLQAAAK